MNDFLLQKRLCTFKLSKKMPKTGQKTGKNPPKKEFFPAPPASWLSLAGYGHVQIRPGRIWTSLSGLARSGHVHIRPGWIWSCLYPAGQAGYGLGQIWPGRIWTSISSQAGSGHVHIRPNSASWPEVLEKNTFFGGFLPVFRPVFCFFTGHLYVQSLFCKKKSVHLTCSGRRSAHYKVPPRIGGCHFLLCQHTNTKDIAGQSARFTLAMTNYDVDYHMI